MLLTVVLLNLDLFVVVKREKKKSLGFTLPLSIRNLALLSPLKKYVWCYVDNKS